MEFRIQYFNEHNIKLLNTIHFHSNKHMDEWVWREPGSVPCKWDPFSPSPALKPSMLPKDNSCEDR